VSFISENTIDGTSCVQYHERCLSEYQYVSNETSVIVIKALQSLKCPVQLSFYRKLFVISRLHSSLGELHYQSNTVPLLLILTCLLQFKSLYWQNMTWRRKEFLADICTSYWKIWTTTDTPITTKCIYSCHRILDIKEVLFSLLKWSVLLALGYPPLPFCRPYLVLLHTLVT
jgi:hypothetical protein